MLMLAAWPLSTDVVDHALVLFLRVTRASVNSNSLIR